MFETSFSHTSATPIPPNLSIENGISILHDFETVIKFSPDCMGCRPVEPKNGYAKANGGDGAKEMQYYEVEDSLPFIPKRLWSGGVKYRAEFVPTQDGCDIIVHAPGGFNSTNRWRLVRDHLPEDGEGGLERVQSKDLLHADTAGSGWYVRIVSEAACNRTYAAFVKGFLKNAHGQQQNSFIEALRERPRQKRPAGQRRPTMGRRKSSVL